MKENLDDINNDLLVKFLLGEANLNEKLLVERWITSEETNRKYFEHFKLIWEQSKQLSIPRPVNEDAAWQRFQNRIQQELPGKILQIKEVQRFAFLQIAAILILIIAGAWLTYNLMSDRTVRTLAVNSQKNSLIDTLPDGSVVTLNKESEIQYPERFSGSTRSISLRGEAFFNVAPDKSKPFVIHVNGISIRVVGTSFNVKSTDGNTEVIVETGKVEVTRNNHSVSLLPKEKIIVNKTDSSLVKIPVTNELYNYYRTKEFSCDDTPLWQLVEVLNQAYNTKIVIERKNIKSLPLTTVFENQPLDSILLIIGETFNLSIVKSGDSIVIK